MSDVAIRVEGLSKKYRIGAAKGSYRTLRETLADTLTSPVRRLSSAVGSRPRRPADDTIWALKDVSFEVRSGEVVGVIGRNGAGKSTLLKILSRITDPSGGYAEINGRVGSLLEVGTGFHLELTGRENVFLNGAILGMRRQEIGRKFDEIVAFAEIEKFIDTPVKHYSSGMHMRLAFSVAAHLEPEILLVDEVLAVGDAAFQKKCLGKMEDVAAQGRTVLFVSHSLATVRELCQTSLVLEGGTVNFRGPVVEGLARYSQGILGKRTQNSSPGAGWCGTRVNGLSGGFNVSLDGGQPILVETALNLAEDCAGGLLLCIIKNSVGDMIVQHKIKSSQVCPAAMKAGPYDLRVQLPALHLAPGVYSLYLRFHGKQESGSECKYTSEDIILDVSGEHLYGKRLALLAPKVSWDVAAAEAAG
jgi:lipopolysaccharide transport system ATP-binding protein